MLLEVVDLQVNYGKIAALKGISLNVDDGEIVTLVGANGAGKTTTLQTISGLRRVTAGSVSFDGNNITDLAGHRRVGLGLSQAPEGRGIFPGMTVMENLAMGAYIKGKPSPESLDRVFTLFPRMQERQKQMGGTLSGGEQQMLAIGRALMAEPRLLLLDEPSMGLAPQLIQLIFRIIKEINEQGTTVLLVEQNASQALSIAHRAYVLETGLVVKTGTGSELLGDPSVVAAYLGGRGGLITLRGAVWGGSRAATSSGHVVVSPDGVLVDVGPSTGSPVGQLVEGAWVGPALVDAHVHLAVASPDDIVHLGVGAVRDLGAPLLHAQEWRAGVGPVVAVAGELITAPGGYPMNSWGADAFGWPVRDAADAGAAVRRLVEGGVDLVKLALEPADGQPVPDLPTCRALVDAAHAAGLAVTCHALNALMVTRALDAGVDELCHTPTEPLAPDLVERIAASGVPVVSTLQTHVDGGAGAGAISNAHALVAAGVAMVYGTDLGNTGTAPGPSSAELELLAEAGLGREGALRAATSGAAAAAGLTGRVDVTVAVGARTVLVVLTDDPLLDPTAWHRPVAVVAGGRVVGGSASTDSAFEGPW